MLMFSSQDPNRTLAAQQSVFGTRDAPKPTIIEWLISCMRSNKPKRVEPPKEVKDPAGDVIRNALFSDLPEVAPDFPILSNPKSDEGLPEQFIVVSLVEDDPDAVQIELFMDDIAEARHKLFEITSKFERGLTPQISEEGLVLKSDRMIVCHPTLPGYTCATCRVMPGKKNIFAI
jgi:hypothetical protein